MKQENRKQEDKKQFLFGAVYIIEQDYTQEEIRRDLSQMQEYGCNLITLWPVGNPWLAKDFHEWVFDQTRMVLDECEKLGMKAILQLFGQNQAQEFMPDSALTSEMMIHDERGEHFNENCFWANLNHPVVREYIDVFFREAINAFKDHSAVYGYDVFNEAHFRSDDRYTIGKYQEWLKETYGTIEHLNRVWYRRYEGFSQIFPEKRRSAYSIWSSIMPDLEYERFRSVTLTEICRFLYDTARKYDTSHPIIIDGTSAQILSGDVTLRNNDEFATAKIPDIYGSTFYPKSWGRNYRNTPWTMSMYYSIPAGAARKADKPYLVNELQTHTQSVLTPGSEVTGQELYDWILMCMFTGAQGMQLWRWRPFLHGYQSTGRGLTRMDGTPNEKAEKVKELVSLIRAQEDLFGDFSIAKPMVKIAVSYSSRLYFDAFLKWNNSFWSEDVEGWYRLFWNHGVLPEFTDLEDLNEEDAGVIVLPSILSISSDMADRLTRFVEQGGLLIADARLASVNEYGEVPCEGIPGRKLSSLFGLVETDVDSGHSFCLGGERIPCNFMEQKLEVREDAQVLGTMEDGSPAVVLHGFGKGKTLYFNSFLGVELKKNSIREVEDTVMPLVKECCPDMVTVQKGERVHVSFIRAGEWSAALVINFDTVKQPVCIQGLPEGVSIENVMTGAVTAAGPAAEFTVPENTAYIYRWQEDEL